MRKKISGVYQIYCRGNDKLYIGASIDIHKRWIRHRWDLDNSCHDNPWMQKSWDEYGESEFVFSVLERVRSKSKLGEREQFYFDELKPSFNKSARANSPNFGCSVPEDVRKKISESHFGIRPSEETRRLMSEQRTGRRASEETKKKMSLAGKGVKQPEGFGKLMKNFWVEWRIKNGRPPKP